MPDPGGATPPPGWGGLPGTPGLPGDTSWAGAQRGAHHRPYQHPPHRGGRLASPEATGYARELLTPYPAAALRPGRARRVRRRTAL